VFGRRRLRTFAWPASAAVVVALLVPSAAEAQQRTVETATSGTVTAELSYIKRTRGSGRFEFDEFRDFRVKITRAGGVLKLLHDVRFSCSRAERLRRRSAVVRRFAGDK